MPLFIAKTKLIILQNVSEINSKNLKTKRLAIIILIAKLLSLNHKQIKQDCVNE